MNSGSLSELKNKLDILKNERDQLNSEILEDRARVLSLETEFTRKQNEFLRARQDLSEKEVMLDKFTFTLKESENTYSKLILNTDRLYAALDQEASSLRRFN